MNHITKRKIKWAIVAVFTILVIIFTFQNTEVVQVRFLTWDVSMSRSVMVIGLLLIGFLLGRITRFRKNHPKKPPGQ
ncbi:lipopolysaccharide assembly protein LapA domain-containing protein [Marinicella sediminis]|uniref:Lipopolysaccharide assembly protein LapA domain-containing protein n=1 Tax=Marinicella sediminis TaxID=1792834 RepID=A0ABV7J5K4_9GAMM|nr:lipopolysaccharide assembly protein LapA domain-containing protein [Marinicella sediminis]